MASHQVVIIGGGPAGLSAGLYASRAGLKSLLIERGMFGGQIVNAQRVENYPGFPEGIAGSELGRLMQQQATIYGLETVTAGVLGIEPGPTHKVFSSDGTFEADAVIIAAGSQYRRLGVPGEDRLLGRGVSYCATCDGFFFRDQEVAVVGGGDTAITDALDLTQLAARVYVIHRRNELRASRVLQERAFAQPRLNFLWDTVVEEIAGEEEVRELKLRNLKTGQRPSLAVAGVFVAVGLKPNSEPFAAALELDEGGHIGTNDLMETSVPGIFAAGDIRRNSARQAVTAAGDGATAALFALRFIQERS